MFVNGRIIQENVVMLAVAENNTRRKKVRLPLSVIESDNKKSTQKLS